MATASLIEFLWFSFTCVSRAKHTTLFSVKSLAIACQHIRTNSSYYLQHLAFFMRNKLIGTDTHLDTNTKTQKHKNVCIIGLYKLNP